MRESALASWSWESAASMLIEHAETP
ncbi:MAG: hypothetical protein UX44_C0021G0008, partial [candidate division WWE3 bacterium GW2011_GWA1_46_21]